MTPRRIILVSGPTRSGKSEWAEHLAEQSGQQITYVATAQVDLSDAEWQARIAKHQQRRPASWKTLAVPIHLTAVIEQAMANDCLLIDSLGTWLANVLDQSDTDWSHTVTNLIASLQQGQGTLILVAEETGWGVVPAYPLGRQFRDRLGSLTRQIGAIADAVYLVTGGYALDLRQLGTPLPS